jgi:O-antigen ligase
MPYPLASSLQRRAQTSKSGRTWPRAASSKRHAIVFLFPVAVVAPYVVGIYLGTIKLTAVKILILLFILPAALTLARGVSQRQRLLMASDALATIACVLMTLIPLANSGSTVLVLTVSQILEFFGSYIIGRAYFFGNSAFRDFVRALGIVTVAIVILGLLDIALQRYIVHELSAALFSAGGVPILISSDPHYHRFILGFDTLRAASTFDHPILFGTFCAAIMPIHLYGQPSVVSKLFYVTVCAAGALIALSSAPLVSMFVAVALYGYDMLLRGARWRWTLLLWMSLAAIFALAVASNNPLSFLVRYLTLDPQTSYYRLLIWDAALDQISSSPWFGIGLEATGNDLLDSSIDCLWLVKAIQYGLPTTILLFLMGMVATLPAPRLAAIRARDPFLDRMCTAVSLTLLTLMFASITVYFWNTLWLFSGLCIGMRVSLKEQCLLARNSLARSGAGSRPTGLLMDKQIHWSGVPL